MFLNIILKFKPDLLFELITTNGIISWILIKIKEGKLMKSYVCQVCGYIYDPAEGDPDNGVKAGTSFESLPEDWVCPVCGVAKDQFEEA